MRFLDELKSTLQDYHPFARFFMRWIIIAQGNPGREQFINRRFRQDPMPAWISGIAVPEYDYNHVSGGIKSYLTAGYHDILAHKPTKMIDIDTLLAWGAVYKKLGPEEIIFREEGECHFYHQLVTGSVRWTNIKDDGGEFIQNMIEPGESFGEFPLFDGSSYAASAITNKESVIIRLHKDTFQQMMKKSPEISWEFLKIFAERMRLKFLLLKELSCFGPEHRISTLFNYFKKSNRNYCKKCNQLKLTRQQVADMTGLRVETVIRSIRHMNETGELVIERGKVYC
jgi:CRP/FNR family cyclic AMP-dependent transcriptional regulator